MPLQACRDRIAYLDSAGAAIKAAFATCYSELQADAAEEGDNLGSLSPERETTGGWGSEKVAEARKEEARMGRELAEVEAALGERRREAEALESKADAAEKEAAQYLTHLHQEWKKLYVHEVEEPEALAMLSQQHGYTADQNVAEVALRRVREACQQIVVLEAENKALKVQVA